MHAVLVYGRGSPLAGHCLPAEVADCDSDCWGVCFVRRCGCPPPATCARPSHSSTLQPLVIVTGKGLTSSPAGSLPPVLPCGSPAPVADTPPGRPRLPCFPAALREGSEMIPDELDPKVVEVYQGVGKVLSRYTAGKVSESWGAMWGWVWAGWLCCGPLFTGCEWRGRPAGCSCTCWRCLPFSCMASRLHTAG